MARSFTAIAAAMSFALTASLASAAPINVAQPQQHLANGVVKVHGRHRTCEHGARGWHRHNRMGERRPCREWHGKGRRPDSCVRVGPLWYCDY
jgi:hypothetical protein